MMSTSSAERPAGSAPFATAGTMTSSMYCPLGRLRGQGELDERVETSLSDRRCVVPQVFNLSCLVEERRDIERFSGSPQPGVELAERKDGFDLHGGQPYRRAQVPLGRKIVWCRSVASVPPVEPTTTPSST